MQSKSPNIMSINSEHQPVIRTKSSGKGISNFFEGIKEHLRRCKQLDADKIRRVERAIGWKPKYVKHRPESHATTGCGDDDTIDGREVNLSVFSGSSECAKSR